jgi:GMP synthase-like glutamine amidotransferase
MAGVLVFQHLRTEDTGALGDLFAAAGLKLTAVELDEGEQIPELDDYDVLLAMGGVMDVWQTEEHPWLVTEKAAIRHWVRDLNRPFLGVCLGHQLLADAFGGTVGPMKTPEVGVHRFQLTEDGETDPLLAGIGMGLEWHGAEVKAPPPGGRVLATNEYCAVQALRVGDRAYGLQFHCEVQETTGKAWSRPLARALGQEVADRLEAEAATHLSTLQANTRDLVDKFLRLI